MLPHFVQKEEREKEWKTDLISSTFSLFRRLIFSVWTERTVGFPNKNNSNNTFSCMHFWWLLILSSSLFPSKIVADCFSLWSCFHKTQQITGMRVSGGFVLQKCSFACPTSSHMSLFLPPNIQVRLAVSLIPAVGLCFLYPFHFCKSSQHSISLDSSASAPNWPDVPSQAGERVREKKVCEMLYYVNRSISHLWLWWDYSGRKEASGREVGGWGMNATLVLDLRLRH